MWEAHLAAEALHCWAHPGQNFSNASRGVGAILAAVAPFFGALPLGMLLANVTVWLLPQARRTLDAEARPFPQTSYPQAQKGLLQAALVLVPAAAILTAIGALLPWYR